MLATITAQGIKEIICLGDLVGYYADPNECIQLVDACNIPCVRGNHDAVAAGLQPPLDFSDAARQAILWTRNQLTTSNIQLLRQLPVCRVIDNHFLTVHAALHPEPNEHLRLNSADQAKESFRKLVTDHPGIRLCFFGHTHRQVVYEFSDNRVSSLPGEIVSLNSNACYLANPGSVGQSRTNDPRAAFLVLDLARQVLHFYRVPYDRHTFRRKAEQAGLLPKRSFVRRSASWIWHQLLTKPSAYSS